MYIVLTDSQQAFVLQALAGFSFSDDSQQAEFDELLYSLMTPADLPTGSAMTIIFADECLNDPQPMFYASRYFGIAATFTAPAQFTASASATAITVFGANAGGTPQASVNGINWVSGSWTTTDSLSNAYATIPITVTAGQTLYFRETNSTIVSAVRLHNG